MLLSCSIWTVLLPLFPRSSTTFRENFRRDRPHRYYNQATTLARYQCAWTWYYPPLRLQHNARRRHVDLDWRRWKASTFQCLQIYCFHGKYIRETVKSIEPKDFASLNSSIDLLCNICSPFSLAFSSIIQQQASTVSVKTRIFQWGELC